MLITLSSLLLCSVIGVAAVYAETAATPTVTLEVPIGEVAQVVGLSQYVQVFYKFAVSAVAVIAGVMIMYSGVMWLSAAGSSQRIGEAKERIIAAISGLILATVSYVLLNTINPALVRLTEPTIIAVEVPASVSQAASSAAATGTSTNSCNIDLVDIKSEMTAKHPEVIPYLKSNGSVVVDLIDPLALSLKAAYTAGMYLHFSGARSMSSQTTLYNCYISSKDAANYEGGKHCSSGCSSCARAAEPSCSAPHLTGRAMDMGWYPQTASSYSSVAVTTPYYNTAAYLALTSCNGGGTGSCPCGSSSSTACQSLAASEKKLQEIMDANGFKRICIEYWHFEYGLSSSYCSPGSYK